MTAVGNALDRWLPLVYVILSLVIGLTYIVLTPPNGTPDEMSHNVKVARIADWNLFGVDPDLALPPTLRWYDGFSNAVMLDATHRFSGADVAAATHRSLDCRPSTRKGNNSVASYSPLLYAPAVTVYDAVCASGGSFGAYLYTARSLNLLIVTLLVGWTMAVSGWPR